MTFQVIMMVDDIPVTLKSDMDEQEALTFYADLTKTLHAFFNTESEVTMDFITAFSDVLTNDVMADIVTNKFIGEDIPVFVWNSETSETMIRTDI